MISSAAVFMYHRFGEANYPSTNIRIEQFKAHLKEIQNQNIFQGRFAKFKKESNQYLFFKYYFRWGFACLNVNNEQNKKTTTRIIQCEASVPPAGASTEKTGFSLCGHRGSLCERFLFFFFFL